MEDDLDRWVSVDDLEQMSSGERSWHAQIFESYDGYPSLERLWKVMDELWRELNCVLLVPDDRLSELLRALCGK